MPQVVATVRQAFVSALGTGLTIGAIVTLAGALLAWTLIQKVPRAPAPELAADPETAPGEQAAAELTLA